MTLDPSAAPPDVPSPASDLSAAPPSGAVHCRPPSSWYPSQDDYGSGPENRSEGLGGLVAVARAELASVYSRPCREHRSIDDPLVASQDRLLDLVLDVEADLDKAAVAEEVRHLRRFGVPVLEIADRLGVSVGRVRQALRGAA